MTYRHFFLRDRVLAPNCVAELFVGREKSIAAIDAALRASKLLFLPLQMEQEADDPLPEDVYNLGALAHIQENSKLQDGTYKLRIGIKSLARVVSCSLNKDFWQSDVLPIHNLENARRLQSLKTRLIELIKKHSNAFETAVTSHRSVPDVLIALRQLIKPALSFSQFNEYRYLNAIGEGLRACWNEGERYINDHWSEIQKPLAIGQSPNIGPFNEFFLEMADTLIQLSQANAALFGWLFVRVGYLKRLKAGDLLNELLA